MASQTGREAANSEPFRDVTTPQQQEANEAWLELEYAFDDADFSVEQRAMIRDPLNKVLHLNDNVARAAGRAELEEPVRHIAHRLADLYASGQKPSLDTVKRWRDELRALLTEGDGAEAEQ